MTDINIDKPIPLENNTKVKFWIVTENKEKRKLGSYKLGKVFDKMNIRGFAHED